MEIAKEVAVKQILNHMKVLRNKLETIEEGAEINVQPDWNNNNEQSDSHIKNKPSQENIDIDFSNYFN